jgi:hypothetical protein
MGEQRYLSRAMTGVLCGAVILAAVAACGSSSSSSHAAAAADPLASLSAVQIGDKAVADFKAASSVHMAGSATGSGETVDVNLWLASDKCAGTITQPGVGSFQLLEVDGTAWVKPDEQFLKSKAGSNPAVLQLMQGKYLKDTSSQFSQLCNLTQIADSFKTGNGTLVKEPYTQIAGQRVLPLRATDNSVGYVTDSAEPLLIRVSKTGSGLVNLTDYNVPFTVTPPPAAQVIDLPASAF